MIKEKCASDMARHKCWSIESINYYYYYY